MSDSKKFFRERVGIFTHSRNMLKAKKLKLIFSNERSFCACFYRFLCLDQVHFYTFVYGPRRHIIPEKNHNSSVSDDRDMDQNVMVHDMRLNLISLLWLLNQGTDHMHLTTCLTTSAQTKAVSDVRVMCRDNALIIMCCNSGSLLDLLIKCSSVVALKYVLCRLVR